MKILKAIAAAALLAFGSIGAPKAQTVEIEYWQYTFETRVRAMDELIKSFEAANPGIKIEATRYAYDDFKQALLTGIAGGEPPDVARLDIVWVPQFAEMGALEAMDTALPDLSDRLDDFFPGPLATNYWNGQYWDNAGDTVATLDHQKPYSVVEHWNDEGRLTNQDERTQFYNNTTTIQIVPKSENSSMGGGQAGSAIHEVGEDFRGPGE